MSVHGRRPRRIEDLDYRDRGTLYTTAIRKLADAQRELAIILQSLDRDDGDAPDRDGREALVRWHNAIQSIRAEMEGKPGR